jgi:hypothetical protein
MIEDRRSDEWEGQDEVQTGRSVHPDIHRIDLDERRYSLPTARHTVLVDSEVEADCPMFKIDSR